jgi:hypothetical protein
LKHLSKLRVDSGLSPCGLMLLGDGAITEPSPLELLPPPPNPPDWISLYEPQVREFRHSASSGRRPKRPLVGLFLYRIDRAMSRHRGLSVHLGGRDKATIAVFVLVLVVLVLDLLRAYRLNTHGALLCAERQLVNPFLQGRQLLAGACGHTGHIIVSGEAPAVRRQQNLLRHGLGLAAWLVVPHRN